MSVIVFTKATCDSTVLDMPCPASFTERGHHNWPYMVERLPVGWTTAKRSRAEGPGTPIKFFCPEHRGRRQ